jgi:hypothetical protein
MSLSNKTFKNNATGEVVRVIDSFENIAVLENKGKAEVSKLLNPDLYTEQIDVSSFFNTQGAYNNLAEKIKNIPADKIRDDGGGEVMINIDGNNSFGTKPSMNESAIIITTEEDERAELARKYGATNTKNDLAKQNEAFNKLLNPDSEDQKFEVNRNPVQQPVSQTPQQPVQKLVEDPIITMFKNVKRSKEFSISLDISNKIPRPDFIEMMEDSYNTSIIDFLASEFTDNLLKNPQVIEDMIKQKIKELVYGDEVVVKDVNSQITDSVTQVYNEKVENHETITLDKEPVLSKDLETPKKTTTTRKPRAKKEIAK